MAADIGLIELSGTVRQGVVTITKLVVVSNIGSKGVVTITILKRNFWSIICLTISIEISLFVNK